MNRVPALVTGLLGLVFLVAGALVVAFVPGALRWLIGAPLLLVGVVNLALVPRFAREKLPPEGDFVPLDDTGTPVVGNPQVRQIAEVLHAELRDTPHRVSTSPDSVRVEYDSGRFVQPGARPSIRRFHWRTTLAATGSPGRYLRLDQEFDERNGGYWGRRRASSGRRASASGRVSLGHGGVTTRTVTTAPVTAAVRTALSRAGARPALSTDALVGLVNGGLGVLVAIAAVVVPLAFPGAFG